MAKLATDRFIGDLVRLYEDAELRLQALVAQAVGRGALGTARYRNQQLGEVRAILRDLSARGVPAGAAMVAQSYALGAKAVEKVLRAPAGKFAGVHQEAVEVLADNLAARLNDAALRVGRQVEDLYRREGLAAAAEGLLTGATRRDVSSQLAANLADQGVRAFEDRIGRRWGLSTYAKMVARTSTREAVSHGTANRLLESGQDLVTVSSHDHEEDECTEFDGETFSLTGTTPGYEVLDELPPFHPNCVHVIGPAEVSFDQAESALAASSTLAQAEASVGIGANLATPAAVLQAVR